MLPYQERAVAERSDLDSKIEKLRAFVQTPAFNSLAIEEQERMKRQFAVMLEYSGILRERINAF